MLLLLLLLSSCETAKSWTTVSLPTPQIRCQSHCNTVILLSSLNEEDDAEEPNHLITAGHYFQAIDEDVGNAMIHAGKAWTSDWSQVAEALDLASHAFWDTLSKKNISPTLQTICRSVAQELEDISTIEGCSSVGPASSLPNWIAIHGYLESAAEAYQDCSDDHDRKIYETLTKTSREIEHLIESI